LCALPPFHTTGLPIDEPISPSAPTHILLSHNPVLDAGNQYLHHLQPQQSTRVDAGGYIGGVHQNGKPIISGATQALKFGQQGVYSFSLLRREQTG
jgi:hypothetical protein